MIGCSRRKWNAKVFRIGWDRAGQSGPRTTQYPRGPLEESAVPSVLAVRGASG